MKFRHSIVFALGFGVASAAMAMPGLTFRSEPVPSSATDASKFVRDQVTPASTNMPPLAHSLSSPSVLRD